MPYSWPLHPFDHVHPVRANFDNPRIAGHSRSFHFGIDISAPNGTPVQVVEAGTVHLEDARAIAVVTGEV
jgi:murein DD-endopeptidase MepM/ murein hydrolase activator NlpD